MHRGFPPGRPRPVGPWDDGKSAAGASKARPVRPTVAVLGKDAPFVTLMNSMVSFANLPCPVTLMDSVNPP